MLAFHMRPYRCRTPSSISICISSSTRQEASWTQASSRRPTPQTIIHWTDCLHIAISISFTTRMPVWSLHSTTRGAFHRPGHRIKYFALPPEAEFIACQSAASPPNQPGLHRTASFPLLAFDCIAYPPLSSPTVLSSFSLTHLLITLALLPCAPLPFNQTAAHRVYVRVYTWLTVCATRNDKFRRCSSGRSAPCRATTPRRTNSPTPPTTQMVSSE